MATTSSQAISLVPQDVISLSNNLLLTTSQKVAEVFARRHDNVIAKINTLDCSDDFRALNFKETSSTVEMPRGGRKAVQVYEMTKDGFMFLVIGFTGKKAAAIKEAYINAFNQMAAQLEQHHRADPPALPAAVADQSRQPLLNDAVKAEIDRQAQLLSARTVNTTLICLLFISSDCPVSVSLH